MSSNTRAALAWSFLDRYLGLLVSLATSMVLARLLTPAQVGIFSLCAAVLDVAATVRDFGVSEYIIQERELDHAKLRSAFAVAIATAWPIGALVFVSRSALASYYNEPQLAELIAILSLSFVILPLSSPAFALLNREMAFRKILVVQVAAVLAGSAVSLILAARGHGAHSLAWGSVAGIAMHGLVLAVMRSKDTFLIPNFRGSRRIFRFGFLQASSRVLETATSNAHEFVIARAFGFTEVGLFSRAKGLVDMFHSNVTGAIARVATPDMAVAVREERTLVHTFARGTAILSCVSWAFFGFLALVAPELIRLMFGPQWDRAGPIASLLSLAMLPTALFALSGSVMAAMGQVGRRLRITFGWCPVHLVVLGVCAGLDLGLEVLAIAWTLTNLCIAALFTRELRVLMRTTLREMYRPTLASVPVALASVGAQFLVLQEARATGLGLLPLLLAVAAAGALAWWLVVRLTHHPVNQELERVVERVRQSLTRRRSA